VYTTIVSKGVNVFALLLLTPILVRQLGSQGFGVLGTLTASALVLGSTADLGISSGLVSKLAATPWESTRTRELLSAALRLALSASAAAVVIAALVSWLLPWPDWLNAGEFGDHELRVATFLAFLGVALTVGTSLGQRIELAQQRGHAVAVWAAVAGLSGPIAAICTGALTSSLPAVIAAYSLPAAFVYAAQTIVSIRSLPAGLRPHPRQAIRADIVDLLREGAPFFGLALAVAVSYQIDTLIVSSILGAAIAGQFNIVARLFGVVGGLAQSSLMQLWAAFSEALHGGDIVWIKRMLIRTTIIAGLVGSFASGVLVLVGGPLIEWWAGPDFRPPLGLLVAAALWTAYSSAGQPLQMFLNGARMQGTQLRAAVPFVIVNVVVSIALTKEIGSPGPVIGSLVANIFCWGLPLGVIVYRRIKALEQLPGAAISE
jgi:O-antigen/teichoic acid export membrane protein